MSNEHSAPKKRGGARTGAGRPKVKPDPVHADRAFAGRLIDQLNSPKKPGEPKEVEQWRGLWNAQDLRIQLETRKYWYDKRDGKAVHTVNHLHDKPIEVSHTFSLADVIRDARERAAKR